MTYLKKKILCMYFALKAKYIPRVLWAQRKKFHQVRDAFQIFDTKKDF